jgi:hypothetical protein
MRKQATRSGVEDLEPCCFRNHFATVSTKCQVPFPSYAREPQMDHVADDPDATTAASFGLSLVLAARTTSGSGPGRHRISRHCSPPD